MDRQFEIEKHQERLEKEFHARVARAGTGFKTYDVLRAEMQMHMDKVDAARAVLRDATDAADALLMNIAIRNMRIRNITKTKNWLS